MRQLRPAPRLLLAAAAVIGTFPLARPVAAQGTIRGIVTDSLIARGPLQGATVVLQGAPHTAVTDRLGRFVMRDVPSGSYVIGFFHPSLDSLEATAPVKRLEVANDLTTTVALGMPTANTLSNALCGRDLERASSVVFGVVRDAERTEALAGAVVRANWFEWRLMNGSGQETRRFEVDTADATGRFVLCGVPNDIALTLTATVEDRMTGDLTLALDHLDIGRRDLLVSRRDTAARVPPPLSSADTVPWRRPPGAARLRVTVQSSNGRPIEGATVGIRGTSVNGRTGADGTVRLVGIPAGSQPLLVRRPGSEPVERIVALATDAENTVAVEMGRNVVVLPTVAVTGQRIASLDREIDSRVLAFNGRLFNEKDLISFATGALGPWTRVPGLIVVPDGFDAMPLMKNSRGQFCRPNLYVNGAHLYAWEAWELRIMLLGAKRMEVYQRPAMQPPQFLNMNDCGSIIIWS
jgi:hypothetical protein